MARIPQPSRYSWTRPESDYNAKYPYNNVMQSESGHIQEFDDTPGAERIRTQHRTGTYSEIQADGTQVNRIVGDNFTVVAKDNNVLITGACNITVEGDTLLNTKGDVIMRCTGNFQQEIEGDYNMLVKGEWNVTTGSDSSFTIGGTAGTFDINALNLDINCINVDVDGEVIAESLYSEGSITAATGIHAGIPGSLNPMAGISTLGSIAAGFPAPPQLPGTITATVSVEAPLIAGIVVTDIRGPMELIRLLYDLHIHPSPKGMTGLPIPLM